MKPVNSEGYGDNSRNIEGLSPLGIKRQPHVSFWKYIAKYKLLVGWLGWLIFVMFKVGKLHIFSEHCKWLFFMMLIHNAHATCTEKVTLPVWKVWPWSKHVWVWFSIKASKISGYQVSSSTDISSQSSKSGQNTCYLKSNQRVTSLSPWPDMNWQSYLNVIVYQAWILD